MKIAIYVVVVVLVLLVCSSCAPISQQKKDRESVKPKVFFRSVKKGNLSNVIRIIEKGADVDAQDNDGTTALMTASEYGHPEVPKLLIEAGAEVNEKDEYDDTALMWALKMGHTEVVELLREEGAN